MVNFSREICLPVHHVISFSFFCDESKLISFHAHTASKEIQQLIVSCIEKNEKDKKNQTKE
jgi:hypothetical protein